MDSAELLTLWVSLWITPGRLWIADPPLEASDKTLSCRQHRGNNTQEHHD